MTIHSPRVRVVVDISEGLVVGATATIHGEPPRNVEGPAALAAMLMLGSGRLTVDPIATAGILNLMSTVVSALAMAEAESPPISPSSPPAASGTGEISRRSAVAADAAHAASAEASATRRSAWVGVLVGVAAMAVGVVFGRSLGVRAGPAPHSAPRASSEMTATPVSSARSGTPGAAAASLAARAKEGDQEAIAVLEQRPVSARTVEETLALAEGRAASMRRGIEDLRKQSSEHLELLEDVRTARRWLAYARDSAVASDALAALASLPSAAAADLVYETWIGTEQRTVATQIAREVIYAPSFRKWASPPLAVALDLRAAETCDGVAALLPRAIEVGDKRSLMILARMNARRNCGPTKTQDCYPCLRKSPEMSAAIRATRGRSAPSFE